MNLSQELFKLAGVGDDVGEWFNSPYKKKKPAAATTQGAATGSSEAQPGDEDPAWSPEPAKPPKQTESADGEAGMERGRAAFGIKAPEKPSDWRGRLGIPPEAPQRVAAPTSQPSQSDQAIKSLESSGRSVAVAKPGEMPANAGPVINWADVPSESASASAPAPVRQAAAAPAPPRAAPAAPAQSAQRPNWRSRLFGGGGGRDGYGNPTYKVGL